MVQDISCKQLINRKTVAGLPLLIFTALLIHADAGSPF